MTVVLSIDVTRRHSGSDRYPAPASVLGGKKSAVHGSNGDDAKAWTWRMPPARHKRLADFRVGYVFDDAIAPVASDIRVLYENVLVELSRSGAKLDRGWPPGVDLQEHLHTFQYLLLALVTADAGPATVAPAGRTRAGLPAGVQIVAAMWEDGRGIEFAALLSDVAGGFTAPPLFRD